MTEPSFHTKPEVTARVHRKSAHRGGKAANVPLAQRGLHVHATTRACANARATTWACANSHATYRAESAWPLDSLAANASAAEAERAGAAERTKRQLMSWGVMMNAMVPWFEGNPSALPCDPSHRPPL